MQTHKLLPPPRLTSAPTLHHCIATLPTHLPCTHTLLPVQLWKETCILLCPACCIGDPTGRPLSPVHTFAHPHSVFCECRPNNHYSSILMSPDAAAAFRTEQDAREQDRLLMRCRLCFCCVCSQGLWANQSVCVCTPQWLTAAPMSSECETQDKGFTAECESCVQNCEKQRRCLKCLRSACLESLLCKS